MKQLLSLLSLMLFVAVGTPTYAQDGKPSSDEIWYTTTDGNIVYPSSGALGSNILSNTYRNGKGVIIVEGDCIKRIGEKAFYGCSSLTSITIPDSVTEIGKSAFIGCSSLTSVYITDIAAWCRISFGNIGANPLYFAHNLYLSGELVTDLIIPDITTIKFASFCGCSSLTSITIPDSVTSIGSAAFSGCSSLTSITIGNSVTKIGWYAFENCSLLTSITIPDSVTSIGTEAFYNCPSLTNFYGKFASEDGHCLIIDGVLNSFAPAGLSEYTIPDSVTEIEEGAFAGCSSLTSITIPDSVTSIGKEAFYSCSSLISITIPDGVTSIGDGAFYGCSSLTSITIPYGVTSIGKEAFSGCIKLEQVYLSSLIPPIIRENAFSGNAQNLQIYIPKEAYKLYLSMECWKPYSNLLERYQPEGAQVSATITAREIWYTTTDGNIVNPKPGALGSKIFSNTYRNGKGVIIVEGDYIEKIGEEAFNGCTSLTSITIPDSVTSIEGWAFYGCSSLTSVTIPDSVTSIGKSAFCDCTSLTSVTMGNGVTSIGKYAFSGCTSLTNFYGKFASEDGHCLIIDGVLNSFAPAGLSEYTIPDSVTEIEEGAFYDYTSLTSITIPDGVTSIGNYAFENCTSLTSINIPDSVTEIGKSAFNGCSSLTSVYITDIAAWCRISFGDAYANPLYNAHNLYLNGELVTDLIIPDITTIKFASFYGCSSLTSITIPDSVTGIGGSAFAGCTGELIINSKVVETDYNEYNYPAYYGWLEGAYFTKLTIGNNITSIGTWAFSGCTSLTSITIGNGVTSIGDEAFRYCSSLTGITIPDSVTSIGYRAFYGCYSLTSITIPDSVTSIGGWAFDECTSLTSITIPDSVTEIGGFAFKHCYSLTKVYCKPTTPPSVDYTMFYDNASGLKIYVPRRSVNAYKNAEYWSWKADAIVGYDF